MVEYVALIDWVPGSDLGASVAFEIGYAMLIIPERTDLPNCGSSALNDPKKLESFCKFQRIILSTRVVHAKFQIFLKFFEIKECRPEMTKCELK